MQTNDIRRLAESLCRGEMALDDFVARLAPRPAADLGEAQVDLDRHRRCGFPEVVFGEGKSVESLVKIVGALAADGAGVLATRIAPVQAAVLENAFPEGRYNAVGRTFRVRPKGADGEAPAASDRGHVAIVTAGTSDRPVAEEARETALWMGARVTLVQDVGVAGPHRFPARLHEMKGADAVVVIAGMEGALPSVVGGYVDCPVIAVPTSVGYGANLGGFAALLGMLNSCAANVTVVNIDAGFKGAYVAGLIARNAARRSGFPA
ncbi:MAG TPA: nickel pincer cofactor biosynthesis protein LarB [Pirellulales bacterium]|nr:nickel pincer cofactor biosynthesis protein LarB [Pirellulales bacterium]